MVDQDLEDLYREHKPRDRLFVGYILNDGTRIEDKIKELIARVDTAPHVEVRPFCDLLMLLNCLDEPKLEWHYMRLAAAKGRPLGFGAKGECQYLDTDMRQLLNKRYRNDENALR